MLNNERIKRLVENVYELWEKFSWLYDDLEPTLFECEKFTLPQLNAYDPAIASEVYQMCKGYSEHFDTIRSVFRIKFDPQKLRGRW